MGEYETAKAFFARVNQQAPGKTGYIMNLANALVFNGDIDEAADLFKEVIRLDPADRPYILQVFSYLLVLCHLVCLLLSTSLQGCA